MAIDWHRIGRWAALGALSGTLATLAIFIPGWMGFQDWAETNFDLGGVKFLVAPLSLVPGIFFGLVIGFALRLEGLAPGIRYPAYVLASGMSYFATVQLTLLLLIDLLENIVAAGIAAGAIGASLLAILTAVILPACRNLQTIGAMIFSGTVLGAALYFASAFDNFPGWLLLFAPWQAGYAAAMGILDPGKARAGADG